MRKFLYVFLCVSYGASQRRPCVRIGLTHAYLSHVKMTLANAKSVNRQTLENVVRKRSVRVYAANCDCVTCLSKLITVSFLGEHGYRSRHALCFIIQRVL